MLENYDQINEEKIVELAGVVGLNIEQFNIDRESEEGRKVIQEDIENGSKIGVRGTPSVFLNGKRINNKELQNISEMIRHELNKEAVPVSTK